jgi:hypothetical protein
VSPSRPQTPKKRLKIAVFSALFREKRPCARWWYFCENRRNPFFLIAMFSALIEFQFTPPGFCGLWNLSQVKTKNQTRGGRK